jgi:hypothetical protein
MSDPCDVATSSSDHQLPVLLSAQREFARKVGHLPGHAQATRIWFYLFDHDGAPLPVVVPVHGVPLASQPRSRMPLRALLKRLVRLPPVAGVACVLERPGSRTLTTCDRIWLCAVRDTAGETGLLFIGASLSWSSGTRLVPGDEWV